MFSLRVLLHLFLQTKIKRAKQIYRTLHVSSIYKERQISSGGRRVPKGWLRGRAGKSLDQRVRFWAASGE